MANKTNLEMDFIVKTKKFESRMKTLSCTKPDQIMKSELNTFFTLIGEALFRFFLTVICSEWR